MKRKRLLVVAAVFAAAALVLAAFAAASAKKDSITGAGSTFVAPLVAQWTAHYSAADINYSAVGSGAGIAQISARTVDFGASDAPMTPDQFANCHGCVQIPWAFAATSLPYNVSGVGYGLKLTGPIVAGIYSGTSRSGTTRRSRRSTRASTCPTRTSSRSTAATVAARATTSPTTSRTSARSGRTRSARAPSRPSRPVSAPAAAPGVAAKLRTTPGGITYVDVAYAYKNHFKSRSCGTAPASSSCRASSTTGGSNAIKKVPRARTPSRSVDPTREREERLPDLHLHLGDRSAEDRQGARAEEVHRLGRSPRASLRASAALPAAPEGRVKRRPEDPAKLHT